jgi:hypothetical protein
MSYPGAGLLIANHCNLTNYEDRGLNESQLAIRDRQFIGRIAGSISLSFLVFPYRVWYRLSTVFLLDRLRSITTHPHNRLRS